MLVLLLTWGAETVPWALKVVKPVAGQIKEGAKEAALAFTGKEERRKETGSWFGVSRFQRFHDHLVELC